MYYKRLWAALTLAAAAVLIVVLCSIFSGCAVAIHGRLATWAATDDKHPPDVPSWGPSGRRQPTTKTAQGDTP